MMQVIIYPRKDGGVCVIRPVLSCGLSIEEIAKKDTPAGRPYRIIDSGDLPRDRSTRMDWKFDFSDPDGHGAEYGMPAWQGA